MWLVKARDVSGYCFAVVVWDEIGFYVLTRWHIMFDYAV